MSSCADSACAAQLALACQEHDLAAQNTACASRRMHPLSERRSDTPSSVDRQELWRNGIDEGTLETTGSLGMHCTDRHTQLRVSLQPLCAARVSALSPHGTMCMPSWFETGMHRRVVWGPLSSHTNVAAPESCVGLYQTLAACVRCASGLRPVPRKRRVLAGGYFLACMHGLHAWLPACCPQTTSWSTGSGCITWR